MNAVEVPPTKVSPAPFPYRWGNRAERRRVRSTTPRTAKLTSQEASAQMQASLDAFARSAEAWGQTDRSTPPPVLGIKASAGVGKTEAVLRALARPEWKKRRCLFLVPSVELGEELRTRAEAMGIDARVIRGRSQPQPGQPKQGDRMCAKHDLAEALAALGSDIANTLCRSKAQTKGGQDEVCPHAATCPYLRQLANKGPGLLIAAHQYLPLTMEGLKSDNLDMVIVDESFWQSMTRQGRVSTSQFQLTRAPGEFSKSAFRKGESREQRKERLTDDMADHVNLLTRMRRVFFEAQETGQPLDLQMFRQAGVTSERCRRAAAYEYGRLGKPEVTAGMARDEQENRIRAAKVDEAFGFARVWKVLAVELDQPRDQLIGLMREPRAWNAKKGLFEDVLSTFYHAEAKLTDIPLVLIDADLDRNIASQFYPVAGSIVTLDTAWRNVRVRQVLDRSVSRNMLAGSSPRPDEQKRHGNRRDDLWWVGLDLSARHGHPINFSSDPTRDVASRRRRPLLVTYKAVEDSWIEDGRIEAADAAETPLRDALPFAIAHLGDIRGKDGWKDASGIVVAGRLEPQVAAVEALARSVFHADRGTLAFIEADAEGNHRYAMVQRPILFRDGTEQMVEVATHPDPRCDAVLRQVREAEVLQAVARVRPVHRQPGNPCEIVVATNVPLPGLLVDEGIEWGKLVPDRTRRMEIAGVVPDLAADCAAAYPSLFPSAAAVRQARSRAARAHLGIESEDMGLGCDKPHLEYLYGKCHTLAGDVAASPAPTVRVEYRRAMPAVESQDGGSREGRLRAGSATVRVLPGDDEAAIIARLIHFLPDAVRVAVVGPLPCPEEQPEEAAAALENAIDFIASWLDTDEVGPTRPEQAAAPPAAPPQDDPDPAEPLFAGYAEVEGDFF